MYKWHTQYPGGFRQKPAKLIHQKDPTAVLRKAVYGMLPRNKLRHKWMERLHLFEGEEHPFEQNIYAELKGSRDADASGVRLAAGIIRGSVGGCQFNDADHAFRRPAPSSGLISTA